MDWPADNRISLPTIHTYSSECVGHLIMLGFGNVPASTAWVSANLAVYVPVFISSPYLVRKVWWANGAAVAGNVDCGLYTADGTLLFSAGSTAQAGTSVVQSVALGTATLVTPGNYYLALAASSASATFLSCAGTSTLANWQKMWGMAQQASAIPLPATATFATCSNTSLPPLFGLTNRTLI